MKILSKIVALLAITMVSCSGPKQIPEKELEAIITDALLINSVINSQSTEAQELGEGRDSTDYYIDILESHNYTLDDFRYTIAEMTARKSNPLEGILEKVVETINYQAEKVEYRYNAALKFDSIALAAYRDTIYHAEKKIRGSLNKTRIEITDQLKRGDYVITLDYLSMSDYRFPQKSARWYFADTLSAKKPSSTIIWLTRSSEKTTLTNRFSLREPKSDSLVIYFTQSSIAKRYRKEIGRDTSYISNVLITYTPPIEVARADYLNKFYGADFVLHRTYDTVDITKIKIPYSPITRQKEEL